MLLCYISAVKFSFSGGFSLHIFQFYMYCLFMTPKSKVTNQTSNARVGEKLTITSRLCFNAIKIFPIF